MSVGTGGCDSYARRSSRRLLRGGAGSGDSPRRYVPMRLFSESTGKSTLTQAAHWHNDWQARRSDHGQLGSILILILLNRGLWTALDRLWTGSEPL